MTDAPTSAAHAPAPSPLSSKDTRTIIIGLMMVMLLAALDQTIVSPALPTIGRKLSDVEHLPWIVTSYLLAATVVTPLYGKFADIVGRRVTLLFAIVVFLAGSALCGFSQSMLFLIVARGIQGLGGGGLMSLVQTVISDIVTPAERAKLQGYFAAVFTTSSLAGPVLGGIIAEKVHWSAIFWINLPVGAVALWIVYGALRKLPRFERPHKVDWLGAGLMAAAAITTMLALDSARAGGIVFAGYTAPLWSIYAGAALLWVLFAVRLGMAEEPLIPTGILKNRTVVISVLTATLAMGVMIGMGLYYPIFLQVIYHMSPSVSGLWLALPSLGVLTGAMAAGRIVAATKGQKYKMVPLGGLVVGALAYAVLAGTLAALPFWGFVAVLFVGNLGIGTVLPVTTVVTQSAVERHQMGTVTGVMNFFRSLGGTLLAAVFGGVLFGGIAQVIGGKVGGQITPQILDRLSHTPHAAVIYQPLFLMAAAGLALAAVILTALKEVPLRGRAAPTVAKEVEQAAPALDLEGADFSEPRKPE
jgi:MFS family permease